MITGISGGEWGVKEDFSAAYDINTGKQVWKAYSTGPDAEMLIDPAKTMTWTDGALKPVGTDSSLSRPGRRAVEERWRHHVGLVRYDPTLNLLYHARVTPRPGTRRSVRATIGGR